MDCIKARDINEETNTANPLHVGPLHFFFLSSSQNFKHCILEYSYGLY